MQDSLRRSICPPATEYKCTTALTTETFNTRMQQQQQQQQNNIKMMMSNLIKLDPLKLDMKGQTDTINKEIGNWVTPGQVMSRYSTH